MGGASEETPLLSKRHDGPGSCMASTYGTSIPPFQPIPKTLEEAECMEASSQDPVQDGTPPYRDIHSREEVRSLLEEEEGEEEEEEGKKAGLETNLGTNLRTTRGLLRNSDIATDSE